MYSRRRADTKCVHATAAATTTARCRHGTPPPPRQPHAAPSRAEPGRCGRRRVTRAVNRPVYNQSGNRSHSKRRQRPRAAKGSVSACVNRQRSSTRSVADKSSRRVAGSTAKNFARRRPAGIHSSARSARHRSTTCSVDSATTSHVYGTPRDRTHPRYDDNTTPVVTRYHPGWH